MKKINIALAGHTSVGKTTFIDTLLYNIGATDTLGKVDDGKSLSDFDEEEIKRKISIHSSVFSTIYKDNILNIIDTPGSSDFAGEVVSCFYGIDLVLLIVDAVNGVEIETTKLWNRAKKMNLPVIILVNKIDKERANFDNVLANLKENLGIKVFPVHLPIGNENSFKGIVDILKMKAYTYEKGAKKGKEQGVPEDLKSQAEELRNDLIETAAEANDELTEKYLEGEDLTPEEIMQGIKDIILNREAIPVMVCSSGANIGVTEACNTLVSIAPKSNAKGTIKAFDASDKSKEIEIKLSKDESFVGLVFKTVMDQFAGKISYIRVFSGTLKSESEVLNSTKDRKEKLSKLYVPFGKSQNQLDRDAEEGDIIVCTKLPHAETGDTLSAQDKPVVLPEMELPYPVHSVAIKA